MYFAGWDDPVWAVSAKSALNNEQYSQWARKTGQCLALSPGAAV